jgi:hypothetical protein
MEEFARFLASCEFATPLYFWIAGALVLLLIFFPWFRKKRGLAIDLQYWKRKVAFKSKRVWVLSLPVIIASVLMAGVLSNPQATTRPITYIYGYPVMIVIDVSGSMGTGTNQRSGYEESLEVFNDLIARRSDINFSLLMFSAENYVARYFINKNELFRDTLENSVDIAYISMGTRINEGLEKARLFLTDNIKGEDKAIVLVSDLDVDSQMWSKTVEEMTRISLAGINLYVITTGEEKQGAFDIPQMPGLKIVGVDDKNGIDNMCAEISAMKMSPIREEEGLSQKSLIPFLILPALGVIYICLVLGETRFRKIP